MKRLFSLPGILLALVMYSGLNAQNIETIGELTQDDYFDWIVRNHPYARQANTIRMQADAELLKARGAFDPKLFSDIEQKSFDGKDYFTIGSVGIETPSQFGLKFKGSYEWSRGIFLSPEDNLPADGQGVLGVSANLGQGLLIDERRAGVRQAQIFQAASKFERQAMLNEVLLDGNNLYWDWVFNNEVRATYERAVAVAYQRLENTKESFFNGDKPAIDTLESYIQWQSRNAQLVEVKLAFQNAGIALTNFLWTEDELPFQLAKNMQAPSLYEMEMTGHVYNDLINFDNIPELRLYNYELESLDVDRRLKTDKLKPVFNLEYNLLTQGDNFFTDDDRGLSNLFFQNYKWGLRASFPLFLRKERGAIEGVKIKQSNTLLKFKAKRQEISTKVEALRNELITIRNQININRENVTNYQSLLDAENIKFEIGESSLFLVNAREQKLLDAQVKLSKFLSLYQKTLTKLRLTDGTLIQQF